MAWPISTKLNWHKASLGNYTSEGTHPFPRRDTGNGDNSEKA